MTKKKEKKYGFTELLLGHGKWTRVDYIQLSILVIMIAYLMFIILKFREVI